MNHRKIETFKSIPDDERLALFAAEDRRRNPSAFDVAGRMGSYISEHPTNFRWVSPVGSLIRSIENRWPWETYINTYLWHPPYDPPSITIRYDAKSFDVWGGGVSNGEYTGYRGKPLPDHLHESIFNYVFYEQHRPINWVCTNGWCWSRLRGWFVYDPPDPYNADMGHRKHLHFTMV